MQKTFLLLAFVLTVSVLSSCTSYTCPTYSQGAAQPATAELPQEQL